MQLISPLDADTVAAGAIRLLWSVSPAAGHYHVQVSTDSTFNSFSTDVTVAKTTFTVDSLLPGAVYFWRVQANNAIEASPWSDIRQFTIALPSPPPPVVTLQLPPNGATVDSSTTRLVWSPVSDAISYQVEIANGDSTFSDSVVQSSDIDSTTSRFAVLDSDGVYFWRVRPALAPGPGRWSEIWSFRAAIQSALPDAKLLVPPDSSSMTFGDVTFKWDRSATTDSAWYRLEVSASPDFTQDFIDSTLSDTAAIISGARFNSPDYWWRITTYDTSGRSSVSNVRLLRNVVSSVASESVAGTLQKCEVSLSPNPASSGLRVSIFNPQSGPVTLRITDVAGREVGKVADAVMEAGAHVFSLNAEALPAGTYLCTMATQSGTVTARLVVTR